MLFVVRFTDRADQPAIRNVFMTAHLDWLDRHKSIVRVAGSLRRAPGETPIGGLWIVEATSTAEVEQLLKTDPFWVEGLRANYEILCWSKAFADRAVPI